MTTGRINQVAVFTGRGLALSSGPTGPHPGLGRPDWIGFVCVAPGRLSPIGASLDVPLNRHPRRGPSVRLARLNRRRFNRLSR